MSVLQKLRCNADLVHF
uniref:Uncharacterized protein n=1 Tax=Rhizophora mucronata TaxID=61149 RepID=A0A2P2PY52_RHIMU